MGNFWGKEDEQSKKVVQTFKEQRKQFKTNSDGLKFQKKQQIYRFVDNDSKRIGKQEIDQDWPLYSNNERIKKLKEQQLKKTFQSFKEQGKELKSKYVEQKIIKKQSYEFTNDDAKLISKKGFEVGQPLYSIKECKTEMIKQLKKLNTDYEYEFGYEESLQPIKGKKMTRTIYLKFQCIDCQENQWTSIAGTFQITFRYERYDNSLQYYIRIYGSDCRKCKQVMIPQIYQTQMEAMKIFFSVILTNILDNKPPPQRPQKYYIRENHWHKKQWCEACKQGSCTTQRR